MRKLVVTFVFPAVVAAALLALTIVGAPRANAQVTLFTCQVEAPARAPDTFIGDNYFEGADDFVVTAAAGWDINTIITQGSPCTFPTQQIHTVSHFFYADDGTGKPGAVLPGCSFPNNPNFIEDDDGDITAYVSCHVPQSTPGAPTWVSQSVSHDVNPFGALHAWNTCSTIFNYESVWRSPFDPSCPNWGRTVTECNATAYCDPADAENPQGMSPADFAFELLGSPATTTTAEVPAVGPLGILTMVLALVGGSVYVLGRGRRA